MYYVCISFKKVWWPLISHLQQFVGSYLWCYAYGVWLEPQNQIEYIQVSQPNVHAT
jgi:hypothetical protein